MRHIENTGSEYKKPIIQCSFECIAQYPAPYNDLPYQKDAPQRIVNIKTLKYSVWFKCIAQYPACYSDLTYQKDAAHRE
jgi:hypothetical protein